MIIEITREAWTMLSIYVISTSEVNTTTTWLNVGKINTWLDIISMNVNPEEDPTDLKYYFQIKKLDKLMDILHDVEGQVEPSFQKLKQEALRELIKTDPQEGNIIKFTT